MARPRLTCSGCTTVGLPSVSAKCWFIAGNSASARTTANPIRCVNEILPPRVRLSWLLITTRLSASSFAGTARTLVAVGTVSDAFMFLTTADAAPRSAVTSPSLPTGAVLAACVVEPAAGLAAGRGFSGAGTDPFEAIASRSALRPFSPGSAGSATGVGAAPGALPLPVVGVGVVVVATSPGVSAGR